MTVEAQPIQQFKQPDEKAIMITNPPYGERISTPDLLGTYKMMGERFKHEFQGNDAWVLSYREECFDQIGLKPSLKTPLYNGSLECELRKYQMFEGKMKVFTQEGNTVKTEEEKRLMAEKHRFKKNREFKQRLEEQEANEEGDIRSFTFHRHDMKGERREARGERREARDERREFKRSDRPGGFSRGERRDGKPGSKDRRDGGKRFDRSQRPDKRGFGKPGFGKGPGKGKTTGKRNFGKQNHHFDDDED